MDVAYINTPSSMADDIRKYDKIMGETGQGLKDEDEITDGTDLAWTWGEHSHAVGPFVHCVLTSHLKPK